jgi:threonine dehydrogenase-like Zn-dependent dehydrogenase
MKAVVFNGPWDVSVEQVSDPKIEESKDAIIKITTANICGSDLRDLIIRGKAQPSRIVSHELPLDEAPAAYKNFDARKDGWTKVLLHPDGDC